MGIISKYENKNPSPFHFNVNNPMQYANSSNYYLGHNKNIAKKPNENNNKEIKKDDLNKNENKMNQIKNEELKNDFSIDINIITKDKKLLNEISN